MAAAEGGTEPRREPGEGLRRVVHLKTLCGRVGWAFENKLFTRCATIASGETINDTVSDTSELSSCQPPVQGLLKADQFPQQ